MVSGGLVRVGEVVKEGIGGQQLGFRSEKVQFERKRKKRGQKKIKE